MSETRPPPVLPRKKTKLIKYINKKKSDGIIIN